MRGVSAGDPMVGDVVQLVSDLYALESCLEGSLWTPNLRSKLDLDRKTFLETLK